MCLIDLCHLIVAVDCWDVGAGHHGWIGRAGPARSIAPPPNDPLQPDDVDDDLHRSGPFKPDEQRNFTSKGMFL